MATDGTSPLEAPVERSPSAAPPLAEAPERLPTAPLPVGHRAREVSAVPPTRPLLPGDGDGVAARLVPHSAAKPRRTRDELLRTSVTIARLIGLLLPLAFNLVPGKQSSYLATDRRGVIVIGAILVAVRIWRPLLSRIDHLLDALLIAVLLLASGGVAGPLAFFAAASSFAAGVSGGYGAGLSTAVFLSSVALAAGVPVGLDWLPEGFVAGRVAYVDLTTALLSVAINPLLAIIGSLANSVVSDNRGGQATLLETNRVLGNLDRLTSGAPEALSPTGVATAAAAEFRRALNGRVAIVLFERGGSLIELGRDGTLDAGPHVLLDGGWDELIRGTQAHVVDEGSFPVRLTRQLPAVPVWVAAPLRAREHRFGVVLVGTDEFRPNRDLRRALAERAAETAVALDNTQLFAKIEAAAASTERERLASDLHDGVAQQLTHVRFELELLARGAQDGGTRGELERLARVTERATDDVRSAIRGLRAQALDGGLVPALRALVNDLGGSSGPTLELDVRGAVEADPDMEGELYRIAQEALSNALRHARATAVTIEVDVVEGTLILAVEDDGVGLGARGSADGDGLGLRTMRARAERLGAQFSVRAADEGGTRMELRMPVEEARHE